MKLKVHEYLKTNMTMNKKKIVKIGLLSAIAFAGVDNSLMASNTVEKAAIHRDYKTETFKVYGNCGMCEKTIEGSLNNVKGVEKADWNKDSKMIEVIFDPEVISLKEIKHKITDVGYDTEEIRATDKVYNNLPGCCQYTRPAEKNDHSEHHQ